eukprot:6212291-Pyramimonas_sp.AAC.1
MERFGVFRDSSRCVPRLFRARSGTLPGLFRHSSGCAPGLFRVCSGTFPVCSAETRLRLQFLARLLGRALIRAQIAIRGARASESAETGSDCYSRRARSGERQNRLRLLFWSCPLGERQNKLRLLFWARLLSRAPIQAQIAIPGAPARESGKTGS